MTVAYEKLDSEELFHLAIKASEKKDHDKAISYLKESLALKADANTQYILAAEHAEIGMYERAIEEMQKALLLNSNLWTAHFQKGLLYLTLNKKNEAIESWQPLLKLPESHYLYHFSKGLISALEENATAAISFLTEGIKINKENIALNNDMQRILENINSIPKTAPEATADLKNKDTQHLFLSAYGNEPKQ